MNKISIFITLALLTLNSNSNSNELNPLDLLKMHLGDSIEVKNRNEIWYCPDNTCEIYKSDRPNEYLSHFVYLNLFHNPSYIYLSQSFNDSVPFVKAAVEEPNITSMVSNYCLETSLTPKCILEGLTKAFKVKIGYGRYDKGYFCYGFSENENICNKL
jgi:hypothetical protein